MLQPSGFNPNPRNDVYQGLLEDQTHVRCGEHCEAGQERRGAECLFCIHHVDHLPVNWVAGLPAG